MADKTPPAPPPAIQIAIRPEARSSQESLTQPFTYANSVKVGSDPFGVGLSFFQVPCDFGELPTAKAAIDALQKEQAGGGSAPQIPPVIGLELPPVAKIWMPSDFLPLLIQALSTQYARVLQERAQQPQQVQRSTVQ